MLIGKLQSVAPTAIITSAGTSRLVLDFTPGNRTQEIIRAMESLKPNDSTNEAAGLPQPKTRHSTLTSLSCGVSVAVSQRRRWASVDWLRRIGRDVRRPL